MSTIKRRGANGGYVKAKSGAEQLPRMVSNSGKQRWPRKRTTEVVARPRRLTKDENQWPKREEEGGGSTKNNSEGHPKTSFELCYQHYVNDRE
ncbi:hypothetical protein DEO72_LG8g2514 [Vigna unguiculata]|uniref:Uncharacterized protein n=1 Tax=Vigna unguiculata TaxID=3917 RepID=A0A4D6MTP8_VIGUN|nr:hypothetical protein DEO72_LG8g2514 [Vigna unguiculata]